MMPWQRKCRAMEQSPSDGHAGGPAEGARKGGATMRYCLVRSEDAVVCGQPGAWQDPSDHNWFCEHHAPVARQLTSVQTPADRSHGPKVIAGRGTHGGATEAA